MAFALPCPASKIGTYASDTMHTIQAWSIAAIKQLYAKFNGIYGVSSPFLRIPVIAPLNDRNRPNSLYSGRGQLSKRGVLTFENGDVAAQVRLKREHLNIAKFEPEHGLDPMLDLVLVGSEWQLKIQSCASN
ncbi:hypothetical protein BDE02_06G215600 [Populus trichocarpa]|nr:hypothetical protein BDE02_06G215600 [Populus trichocarpa]